MMEYEDEAECGRQGVLSRAARLGSVCMWQWQYEVGDQCP
jgi:hypothetical protein